MAVEIRRVGDLACELGEGPVWDSTDGVLYFVDITGGRVWRCDPERAIFELRDYGTTVSAVGLRASGGLVVACGAGIEFLDFASGRRTPVADPNAGDARTRFNDAKVDRRGRFLVATMDREQREPLGRLYVLAPDHSLRTLATGFTIGNGPAWSPDGRTFYLTDSGIHTIFAYDYDPMTGDVSNRRTFATSEGYGGTPDGCTVDADGGIWSCFNLGGKVVRLTPDGRVDRVIDMPVDTPSSLAFGGPRLDVLFVTSMRSGGPGAEAHSPEAGGLFAVHGLGVVGLPEPRYAG